MRKIDPPPAAVQDVVRRRLRAAPSSILVHAFGVPKLSTAVYHDTELAFVGAGSSKFVDQLALFNLSYGTPAPWFKVLEQPPAIGYHIRREGSGRFSMREGIFDGGYRPIVLTADPGVIGRLRSIDLTWSGNKSHVECLVIATGTAALDWYAIASEFETMIVEAMSPHIRRL
ncbi:hypothetical protein [Rhizobium phaseoli]|uniref:hypothetical protein n=1 Tax=Rhizobium phaseoli TaxID=396 RepID=UPI0007EA4628|nr:hypothetical protein [Rhizobium phaseoli]